MDGHWKDFMVADKHDPKLGGNLRHGDGQTTTPVLWQALIDRFAPRSMLDVGAGEGQAVTFFSRRQVIAHGIDGLRQNVARSQHPLALHDITSGPYIYPCDMVYCVEVLEHIEEVYLDHLMTTLTNAPIIVVTHALPGQNGHHHVNNQPPEYWLREFDRRGYRPTIDNDYYRSLAAEERPDSYFAQSGLILLKTV